MLLSAQGFAAALLVWNRINQLDPREDFEADLRQLGQEAHDWLVRDRLGAAAVGVVPLIILLVIRSSHALKLLPNEWVHVTFGVALALWAVVITVIAANEYKSTLRYVANLRRDYDT
jgi:hypothetical protein